MSINDIAQIINSLSSNYEMAKFQSIRKEIKKLRRVYTYNIFSAKSIFPEFGYAFHTGGREEIQYNIAYEEDSKIFRFGLAFSLEPSLTLPNPTIMLRPKILAFNQFVKEHSEKLSDLHFWYYQNNIRSQNQNVIVIKDELIRNNTFLFIGKFFKKKLNQLSRDDLYQILQTFDNLLEIYKFVEESNLIQTTIQEKIARLCWNDQYWQKPSGWDGKSNNEDTFEARTGYAHEEWLLDKSKIIDGYHYGFLQQVSNNINKYRGEVFHIDLYTINDLTKERWWIGKIKNVEIISEEESAKIYSIYLEKKWIQEMTSQLDLVGANVESFENSNPRHFTNLKFKIDNLELLDTPARINNYKKYIRSTYYSNLVNKINDPQLDCPESNKRFNFIPGHNEGKQNTKAEYGKHCSDINLVHNKMQTMIYNQLVAKHGRENVGTEQGTGYGSLIDIAVKMNNSFIFYELKTSNSIKICIREALAQLLEYSYWSENNIASKLIIVSQNVITPEAKSYLLKLRKDLKIPVYYQRFNNADESLEENEY